MCGILGEISRNTLFSNPLELIKTISERGPDSSGIFVQDNVFMGHSRLAVMDKSVSSSQPMHYKNYVMVFNGSIYNYQELRNELETYGYQFYSSGDSEVVIKAFDKWGKDCPKKFNGSFSIAVWDRFNNTLFLIRDRLGIKPLYYTHTKNGLKFSSRLQSLLTFTDTDKSLNIKALNYYFSFHSVVPAPDTVLNGVRKVPPARVIEYSLRTNQIIADEKYWPLSYKEQSKSDYHEIIESLDYELHLSVKRRLVSESEVGVMLSGGLDSSLITAIISDYKTDIPTYSIGFESTEQENGNEFFYSDIIASKFSTRHNKILINSSRLLKSLPEVIRAMSEPMISYDNPAFYLLSQEISRTLKVVQTGQGADEIFAGYHWYSKMADNKSNLLFAYQQYFFDRSFDAYKDLVMPAFIEKDYATEFVKQYIASLDFDHNLDKSLHLDTNIMLVDDPLKRVDNMTMAWGLEARVPFLDHQLLEFVATIPANYKYRNGGKFILKELARKYLPDMLIDRAKVYFPVPELRYPKTEINDWIRDILDSPESRKRGLYNQNYLDKVLKSPEKYISNLGSSSLWQIALLEFWFQENKI